jgi:hypothetical protein
MRMMVYVCRFFTWIILRLTWVAVGAVQLILIWFQFGLAHVMQNQLATFNATLIFWL